MFLLTGLLASMSTKVLFTRLGGVGDMVMAEPVLEAVHDKYAPCEITYRTHRYVYDLMLFHPLIDKILCTRTGCWTPTPEGYDVHVNLHGVIENAPFGMHGIDAFAQAAGVEVKRRTPNLYLTGEERPVETEDDRYPKISHPIPEDPTKVDICIHMPQEPRNRLWQNPYFFDQMVNWFKEQTGDPSQDVTVRVVGQEEVVAGKSNILRMAKGIAASKMFIGPDSGGFHIAAALGIPTVVSLTDKFPASMRGYAKVVCVGDEQGEDVFRSALALYRTVK